jgi:DNA-binding NtrC family response regulator
MEIIFASGYFDDRGILDPRSNFIQKPFNPDKLTRTVRRVLDRRHEPA